MVGTWKRLAHVELSSSGSTLDSGTFTETDFIKVIVNRKVTGGNLDNEKIRFNSDSGSNYAFKHSTDGAGYSNNTSDSGINFNGTNSAQDGFTVINISNKSNKEKQVIVHDVRGQGSGASNAPQRQETVGKWVNTSSSITSIQIVEGGSGSYASGSYITVFGASDDVVTDEKTTLTNVPIGTRYEETDTRKIYRRAENSASASNMEDSGSWSGDGSLSVTSGEIQVRLGGSNAGRAKRDYGTSNIDGSKWLMRFKWEQNGTQTLSSPNDMRCIIGLSSSDGSFGGNSPTYGTTTQDCVGMYMDVGHVHLVGMNNTASPSTQATADSLLDYDHTGSAFTKYVEIIRNGDSFTLNIYPNSDFTGTVITSTKTISNIGSLRYVGSQAGWYGGGGGINADISDITFYNGVTSVKEWKERGSA